jgi:phosphate transport system permease protein
MTSLTPYEISEADPTVPVPVIEPGQPTIGLTELPRRHLTEAQPTQPRRVGGITRDGVLNALGGLAVGLCIAMLLFGRLAAFSGLIGFIIVAYVASLAAYAVLVSVSNDGPAVRNALMTAMLGSAALLAFGALVGVILFTFGRGYQAMLYFSHWYHPTLRTNFFTQDLSSVGPSAPLSVGGIQHALVGTLWMISIALAITVPLGLTCAVYLNESRGRLSQLVRTVVEAMTAFPSVLSRLFVFATWILLFHFEKSALAAALALSVEMLPIMIRASEVLLRLVPGNLREAFVALGAPAWRTATLVVLPTARSGLITAVILATARGIGESAPVLLTAGYTTYLNTYPIHGPMVSLPLVAFQLVRTGQPLFVTRGFGAAAFLLLLVLALFVVARVLGGRRPGNLTARQLRKAIRGSGRGTERFLSRVQMAADGLAIDLGTGD